MKLKTEILSTRTPELFEEAVSRAARLLRSGELVCLPTETVYGLAANALDESAVARIFQVKGRPSCNPVIVHVCDAVMAAGCVAAWTDPAARLARAFWPGPLTIVLPRASKIAKSVTAGGATVGVRWPAHPFIQAVIRECGFPLAAPSANLSNRISPTTAGHVLAQLEGRIPLIVDGGPARVGIESTVLDLSVSPPVVLRPGMIHAESLGAVCGPIRSVHGDASDDSGALRSPGMLARHYSPRARLVVLEWRDREDLSGRLASYNVPPSAVQIVAHTNIPSGSGAANVSVLPHDAGAFARALYAEMHRCDEAGAGLIVMEAPPSLPEWRGIADRLRRAAA